MKIVQGNDIVLYLKNEYLEQQDMIEISECFKELFEILKEYYRIKISGFYDIKIYRDEAYGMIIVLRKELLDFDYYDNQIDMKITFFDTDFLYEIEDLYEFRENTIYQYKDRYYIDTFYPEFSEIIYDTTDIIKYGKLIEI